MLQPVWRPEDTRDVFERAATFHASQPSSEVTVDESGLVIR
jgi:hypothetical protein